MKPGGRQAYQQLMRDAQACRLCEGHLKDGVRPVFQVLPQARILIAGQAPGRRVHESGVPFDDASGDRLRDWMGVSREVFYDAQKVAVLPMSFCFPGSGRSGDLAPRRECAPAWRQPLLDGLEGLRLTLLVGSYAQRWHLPKPHTSLTETVRNWRSGGAGLLPLPHPSPRNNVWLARHPWFAADVLPVLRARVRSALS